MRAFYTSVLACALLLPAFSALAAEQDSESRYSEAVIVTATYRETNLMDTAQSINAVTDTMVEDLKALFP